MQLQPDDLYNTVMAAPIGICVLDAATLTCEIVNTKFIEVAGKPYEAIYGQFYWDSFAEARAYYEDALNGVVSTGEAYYADEVELMLIRHGKEEMVFVTFVYVPIKGIDGKVMKVAIWVLENTAQVKARQEIGNLNEELAASNEEMGAANEELMVTNEELVAAQQMLEESVTRLTESEARFRMLVQQAPVAISIQKGPAHFIESANNIMLAIVGKKPEEFIGKPYREALYEMAGQPFFDILDRVYATGETFYGYEEKAFIYKEGRAEEGYFNFIYQAIKDEAGFSTGIMIVATDVTEQVLGRAELEEKDSTLKQALESANIGTWSADLETDNLLISKRAYEIHGLPEGRSLTLTEAMTMIAAEHREMVADNIQTAINRKESFVAEYIIAPMDGSTRKWLRATGKPIYENGVARMISGTMMDITEQKQDDQRKSDFIGMVSHELKTPLTSLTALIQVANTKLKNNSDSFLGGAMEKANIQVRKMTTMINGFLNISRLESSLIAIDKKAFDLEELIKDIVQETELTMTSHQLKFEPCEPLIIYADPDKISSVISNLISNAIKYSPKGHGIEINCGMVNDTARVSIRDEGMGINPEDQDKLFDRYYRIENANTRHISGFGIGLYLSAEIIKRHGGKIWVESKQGEGSTFYFSLPINA